MFFKINPVLLQQQLYEYKLLVASAAAAPATCPLVGQAIVKIKST